MSPSFSCFVLGSREHGLKYQQLVHGLNIAGTISHSHCSAFHCLFIAAAGGDSNVRRNRSVLVRSCAVGIPQSFDASADVKLDRKSLSELAKNEPLSFQQIVEVAKSALASNYDKCSQGAAKGPQ
jgi:hypothetical protein